MGQPSFQDPQQRLLGMSPDEDRPSADISLAGWKEATRMTALSIGDDIVSPTPRRYGKWAVMEDRHCSGDGQRARI